MQPEQGMTGSRLLVLDFDGVICDSVEECFVTSWTAFHERLPRTAEPAPGPDGPQAASVRDAFRRLRPFIRSGEDFMLIQRLVSRGIAPRSQAEFDRQWEEPDMPSRAEYKELFYRARMRLWDRDPAAWLAMNHVYPHVPKALARLSPRVPLYVLSTKKPPFVIAPLEAARLFVPRERVLYSESEPKLATVERLLRELGREEAVFVEDQIDAIRSNRNPRIRTFLATWGYVQPAWLRDPGSAVPLTPEAFEDLVASL